MTSELDNRKTAVIRARAPQVLKSDLRRAARIVGLDEADLIRMGVQEKVATILSQARAIALYGQAA